MKSTGIVRKVDELGRVVIPIELRRNLGIAEKDALEIYVDDDKIILKKYKPNMTCLVTGEVSDDNLQLAGGKIVLSREGAELLMQEIKENFHLEDQPAEENEQAKDEADPFASKPEPEPEPR
ncbi:AbrB/MazE/SpoVT family DNA-binding domain-containing protein [Bacillus coagulans]|jgi:transcriptional pleiotropic regulator of transition state genes|nr:AbrB/MazE/SpoVT family DNA-binding domain-containing protein [Heyndrickxia coagulans]